jgi:alkanesulfonate monooxygenase SsuD/methylene tetrahydromethanopterin reductase-like flavin-dependent oxidoreductase (luciferase family)
MIRAEIRTANEGNIMQKPVSVGIHIPSVSPEGLEDGSRYGKFFREVEALGFDAIWVEDRIFHPAPLADAVVLLSWAAANTVRLQLGTAVMVINLRQAPVVARQVATLQHLSGGRLNLGISLGGTPTEYQALGVPFDRRVGVFRESLQILRAMLTGAPIDHQGTYFELRKAIIAPAAPTTILIGGVADAAIRRAGELGDGWIMAPFGSLDDFARGQDLAREGAAAAGKNPDDLTYGRLLYVAVDEDREKARQAITKFLHGYYGPDYDVDNIAIFGPADEVRARLRDQVDAGISQLMLAIPSLDSDHLRRLADEVMPTLR